MPLALAQPRYRDVELAVDPTLDAGTIPDATIGSDVYAGQAVRTLLRSLPNAEIHNDQTGVQRALVYLTAAFLAEALPAITQGNFDDHAMQMQRETPQQRKGRLLGLASLEMQALQATDATPALRPQQIITATAGRRT